MKKINSLKEIDYKESLPCSMEATVIDILQEGDGEKKPIKYVIRLEESGETTVISSWKYALIPLLKQLLNSDEVAEFEGLPSIYGNFGEQIRGGNITLTGKKSVRKVLKNTAPDELKKEIDTLVRTYVPSGILKEYLKKLIFEDERFFRWPAAQRIHHSYEGGLALHSLNVCKQALALSETYKNENVKLSLVVTGSLLHDIGKLEEYNEDGSRTIVGNLLGHHSIGYGKIIEIAKELGINPLSDAETVMLLHIILSHHGKLEFGSPVVPGIMEAVIVSTADEIDAKAEALNETLVSMKAGEFSGSLVSLHGGKIYKWTN